MEVTDEFIEQLQPEIKPTLNSFDSDIIEWMKKDPKYCLKVQQMLDTFIADIFQ